MKKFIPFLVIFCLVSIAQAQTFDYTPPVLGSSAKVNRDDLQLEYTGINTNKIDLVDIDTSAEILAIVTNETGTGALVFATSPTLVTPALGTPTALVLTNATGLPVGSLTGLGTGVGTWLATPSTSNLAAAVTGETGTGAVVFATSPALVTPALGVATATSINGATITSGTLNGSVTGTNTGDQTITLTGDVTGTGTGSFPTTVAANSVALTTDTAGNYQSGNTAGAGIAVTQTPAEGFSATIAFNYSDQGSDPALVSDACQFTSNATVNGFIVCEGETADTFETRLHVVDPTADRLVTWPNADSNTVQPLTCNPTTEKVSAISALGVLTCSPDAGAGAGISNVIEDIDPELGGALDTNGFAIELGTANTDTSVVRSSAGNISIEGNVVYRVGGTDVSLADGGTGASLVDPNADRIMFWDDSAAATAYLTPGSAYVFDTTTFRSPRESLCVAVSDETTDLTTGIAKVTWRMPYAFTLINIRGSVNDAAAVTLITVDINEGGTSVATTNKLTIDIGEETSVTAATAIGITDTSLADDAEMTADIDGVGTTASGLKVCLIGYQT